MECPFPTFGDILKEVTADSGYCSEKKDIGKYYNMRTEIFEDEHYYICHDERKLRHIVQKRRIRKDTHRLLKFMDVQTAADMDIKRSACNDININKYHRFVHQEIQKFEGKTEEKTA